MFAVNRSAVSGRFIIVFVVLFGALVCAAPQEPLRFKVDVELTALDVYVDNASGRPVTNLTRDDFSVFEDGQPREIRNFESAESPYNILLLFDRSSSTEEQWAYLTKALSRFLDRLPVQHRVAVAAFDDRAEVLYNWTSAREFSRRPIAIHSNNAGTNLYGALEWAALEVRKIKGRRGVIVFTDGVDNRLSKKLVSFDRNGTPSVAPMEDDNDFLKMLRTVTAAHNPFYFVAVNTDQNPDPREPYNSFNEKQRRAARLRMQTVAELSSGVLHLPTQMEDVETLYATIGQELGNSYNLAFTPGKSAADGSFHRIEVRVRDRSLKVTQSREGYYAR
jgi:Ca-activated chloride channel family protein